MLLLLQLTQNPILYTITLSQRSLNRSQGVESRVRRIELTTMNQKEHGRVWERQEAWRRRGNHGRRVSKRPKLFPISLLPSAPTFSRSLFTELKFKVWLWESWDFFPGKLRKATQKQMTKEKESFFVNNSRSVI